MSFSWSSTFALPTPARRGSGTRSVVAPAERFPNVFEASVARPRRSRTRAFARSAGGTRTVYPPPAPDAVKRENPHGRQRSNARWQSDGAVIVRLHGFF